VAMDAREILAHYNVPDAMPLDYAGAFNLEPAKRFSCVTPANELWKIIAALHIFERAGLSSNELEFSTHHDALQNVAADLQDLFKFLTDTSVRISIRPRPPVLGEQTLLEQFSSQEPIVLFSPGLDSLAAALATNESCRPVLLHVSTSNIMLAKARELRNRYPVLLADTMVSGDCRFSSLGGGISHTRGLLFLSAAFNAALTLGITRIIIGENGPLMINPSVSPFSVPTRNAHPKLIEGFQKIIQKLGYPEIHLAAMHKDMTKSEVLLGVSEKLGSLASKSYSCSITQGQTAMCGLCFACFVRKTSMLAIGVVEPDSLYEADPFAVDIKTLGPVDQGRVNDLKDSMTYFKQFIIGPHPNDWLDEIPSSFFTDPDAMLRRFALDLFVGTRRYFRLRESKGSTNALSKYCLDAIGEIGSHTLDEREAELGKGTRRAPDQMLLGQSPQSQRGSTASMMASSKGQGSQMVSHHRVPKHSIAIDSVLTQHLIMAHQLVRQRSTTLSFRSLISRRTVPVV